MGMDANIWSARNSEVFKHDGWWNSEQVVQEWYGRKFWSLVEYCSFIPTGADANGDFIEITIENVEEMIRVACEHRNYWDNYDDVPKFCMLRDKMRAEQEQCEENGEVPRKYFFEYDY